MFKWDYYSDQPYPIRDKKVKKEIYKKTVFDTLKIVSTNVLLFPLISGRFVYSLFEQKTVSTDNFFAMSVNLDKSPELSVEFIEELGVKDLLIRLPLRDIENLEKYKEFIEYFNEYNILVNILQDRKHIEDEDLLKRSVNLIFDTLNIKKYQIGNAINRKKWAFFTMDEYMQFFKIVQEIRDNNFKEIKLLGSSVIDFEYHFSVRTLFNFHKIHYDCFTSLLYVDRRGSPQNSQMGLDLIKKIKLLYSMVSLSPKSSNDIVITESNWPISNTAPYAPTSEKECVSLDDYAKYMVQYYLLTLSTGMVSCVYWHQLIAPGYGLIDNRDGITKYPAFKAFKTMITLLKDAKLIDHNISKKISYMVFDNGIEVFWSNSDVLPKPKFRKLLSLTGDEYQDGDFLYIIN